MAYLTKEIYEKKEQWRRQRNMEILEESGLDTDTQYAICNLLYLRHEIHCRMREVYFAAESPVFGMAEELQEQLDITTKYVGIPAPQINALCDYADCFLDEDFHAPEILMEAYADLPDNADIPMKRAALKTYCINKSYDIGNKNNEIVRNYIHAICKKYSLGELIRY
ncbi:MAG: hypothetical protein LBG17_04660 [Bacteroidales bacterium]|jgi:hypothetical protein|nr:hypothetical protein [Bacteroidales bacterium]